MYPYRGRLGKVTPHTKSYAPLLHYKPSAPLHPVASAANAAAASSSSSSGHSNFQVRKLASENGVVIFSKSSCCLCYAVQHLFQELRANAVVYEIDHNPDGKDIEKALTRMGCGGPVPAIFVGGKLVGSTNEVMSLHLSGSLIPLLKPYQSILTYKA